LGTDAGSGSGGALLRARKIRARQEGLARRESLPDDLKILFSAVAVERLRSLREYRQAEVVLAFASFGSELRTQPLFESIWQDGKILGLPVAIASERRLEFRQVRRGDGLRLGRWHIPEPLAEYPMIAPKHARLLVVPGVAFDVVGCRVGYGGGYYDRLLRQMLQDRRRALPPFWGLAFEVQVFGGVPAGASDQQLDGLVTDSLIRRFRRA